MKRKILFIWLCVCWTICEAQNRLTEITHIGPFNARQRSIALLADNNRWFLGTDGGGLWMSENTGETWKPYDTLNRFGGKVYDIHQQDNLIVYSVPSTSSAFVKNVDGGIYVSEDRGQTFRHLIGNHNFSDDLLIKDMDIVNGKIYFQSLSGIYKANLNGSHEVIYSGKVVNMAVTALDENTEAFIFYDGLNENDGLFFLGRNRLKQKLPFPEGHIYHAAVAPTAKNVVYVVASLNSSSNGSDPNMEDPTVRKVYKSEEHGLPNTYETVFDGNLDYMWWSPHFLKSGTPGFEGVKVLNNPNHLVISSVSMAYSNDGGRTWREKRPSNLRISFGDMWPNSVIEINNQIILGHDHGLFGGSIDNLFKPIHDNSYTPINADSIKNYCQGLPTFTGYVGDVNGEIVSIGGQDRGTFLLNGEREIYVGGGDVYMTVLLNNESYSFNKHGVSLVERYDLNGNFLGSIDYINEDHSRNQDIQSYTGYNQVGKNSKGEIFYADDASYEPRGSVIIKIIEDNYTIIYRAPENVNIFSIAVTENVSYFLESGPVENDYNYWALKKVTHSNQSITTIIENLGNIISDIETCPSNPNLIFGFMFSGKEDPVRIDIGTQEVTSIRGNLPANVRILSLTSIDSMQIFLGTNCGIFSTINGGNHWNFIDDFPFVHVYDIDIQDTSLYAFTYGRGAIKATINNLGGDILPQSLPVPIQKVLEPENPINPEEPENPINPEEPLPVSIQKENRIKVYPVPTSNAITLYNIHEYDLIEFFDLVGRKVRTLRNDNANKMTVRNLPTGTGFVVLTNTKTRKSTKQRIIVN